MSHGSVITIRDGERELVRGLKRQSSVIMAIIFKEFKVRIRTSKFGLFYMLIEPMVLILMISSIWYMFRATMIDGIHVLVYLPLGFTAFLVFKRGLSSIPSAVRSNQGLLDYPQVKPIDSIIAVFIFDMVLTLLASALAMLLIWWATGIVASFPQPLEALGLLGALLALSFGCSTLLAVYGTFYENIPRTVGLFRRPLIFVSGVIFPVKSLPPDIQWYLSWNPLLHFTEGARYYAAGHQVFMYWDLEYTILMSAAMLGIGYIAYFANRYRMVQSR